MCYKTAVIIGILIQEKKIIILLTWLTT